jgi:predicted phosphodiesterase
MNSILMCGDVHSKFNYVLSAVDMYKPKAIILLGDIEATRPLERELESILSKTEVYFIHGNHDTDSVENYRNLFQSELADRNLHGKVTQIGNVKVAALGGIFRSEVWYPIPIEAPVHYESYAHYSASSTSGRIVTARQARENRKYQDVSCVNHDIEGTPAGKMLVHKSTIFYEEWFDLYGRDADVLVTHEAPGCHPYGFDVLTDLARSMHVKAMFHGHQHDSLNYEPKFKELGFSCYGVGLRGITSVFGEKLVDGKLDAARGVLRKVTDIVVEKLLDGDLDAKHSRIYEQQEGSGDA